MVFCFIFFNCKWACLAPELLTFNEMQMANVEWFPSAHLSPPRTTWCQFFLFFFGGELSWRFKLRKYGSHYSLAFPRYARRSCVAPTRRARALNVDWCKWIFIVVEFLLTARRRSIRRVPIGWKELKAESVQEILPRLDLYISTESIALNSSMWKFIIFLRLEAKQ